MFNTGVTDLSPELIGWYGAPGINVNGVFDGGCHAPCNNSPTGRSDAVDTSNKEAPIPLCVGAGTTLFLVGDNFSIHDTKVIAGGVCIPHVRLISREIMRVTIHS